jgi:hypothetical protein
MRISRRAAAVIAATATGVALLGGAGAALASSPAPASTHDRVQVLRFHTVGVSAAVNDAGHGGPANVIAVVFDVRTTGGAEAGKAYISCTAVTGSVTLCHAAFVLRGGQIEAQVTNGMSPTFTAAVTGGTGIYKGVTGQIRNVATGPRTIDRTFYLIHPDHD